MAMGLTLLRPTEQYAAQVMQYREEMLHNQDSLDGCAGLETVGSFSEWIGFSKPAEAEIWPGLCPLGGLFGRPDGG